MTTFLIIVLVLLTAIALVGGILFTHSRKLLREQKNVERGLKMVPLLIHLPPPSDDTEIGGRDSRDVMDENISKAQILYSIIASTLQKTNFKTKFYGQRHFAFEIVGQKGFVHYYAAVPVSMVEIVKQAVVSAYPAARLEEVAEHNIFSPVGKISGTIGGELTLKESFAYPIATYQDLKRDAMQSLLSALWSLEKEDGAGIQILMRPADPGWVKKAQSIASKKRKGKDGKKGGALIGEWGKQLATAAVKPPEDKKKEGDDKPNLSSHEQTTLDAIDQKTAYPGYEVLIRVVVSSNITQRAQAVLGNVVAAFSLFDAPGRNGFKYTPSNDIESFVTAYILRFFPPENNQNILNTVELATIFHFPDQKNIPTSQLERQGSKQVDGPRNISEEGLFLGYNVFRGVKKPIRLSENDRRRHMYLVGQTGTGKSTLLENLALQDMLNGKGFAFIDPHGDTAERLLAMVPRERTEDVIYFCPADMEYPLGLNLFEFDHPDQKDFLIQEAINMLYKLYDPQHTGIIGPRYEHWFRNAALTIMSNPEGGTFIDIPKVFTDKAYERKLKQYVTDQTVLDFWNKEMAATSDYHKSEILGWFVSKFGAFLSNQMMRDIIGQSKSSFNLRDIMDNKKILLVNLSKGRTGELNSKLLGMIFVMKFQAAAMSRASIPEDERQDFSLYVDEFQNFSTDSFATILSEARKYHLNLIVANQFTTQLSEEIRDAVFGNIGTVISYRVGTNDADFLSKQFQPIFDVDDLQRIPNFNTVVRMLIGGVPAQPFSMAGMPELGKPNQKLMEALKQLSAAKYGRPRAKVDAEIMARIRTPDAPPRPAVPAYGAQSPFGAAATRPPASAPGTRPATPGSGSSFLDDWLAKRRAPGSPVGVAPAGQALPFAQPTPAPRPVAPMLQPAPPTPILVPEPAKQPAMPMPEATATHAPSQIVTPLVKPGGPTAMTPAYQVINTAPAPKPMPEPIIMKNQADLSVEADPKSSMNTQKRNNSKSGEIHLKAHVPDANAQDPEDTIYIDNEGLLHDRGAEEEASKTAKKP
ncbi:MAG: type IV secretory system conjugative DNA transfer family protein [Candidatus Saccharibacteria bacterium]